MRLGTLNHASIIPNNLVLLALAEDITELLQRAADELSLLPEVGGEEAVGVDDGNEGGLEGVLEGLGGTGRGGVGILDTSKLEKTLDSGGGNETGTAGSGDQLERETIRILYGLKEKCANCTHFVSTSTIVQTRGGSGDTYTNSDGTTLAGLLDGQRVRLTEVGTPVTAADGKDSQLGNGDSGTDSSGDFLGGLDAETDVALTVTDENNGLEAGTLTGTGLLLDGLDL